MRMNDRLSWILEQLRDDRGATLGEPQPEAPDRTAMDSGVYGAAWTEYHRRLRDWKVHHRQALDGVVPLRLAGWLGRAPTHSETTLFSRAYAEGERRGLWRCLRDRGRTWALQLVPEDEAR